MNRNIIVRVVLSVLLGLELVAALMISYILYNGIMKIELFIVIFVILIFFNEYLWMEIKKRGWLSWIITLQVVLLIIFPIIFWAYKPQYTFLQAKAEVIQRADFLNGYIIQDKKHINMRMINSPNFLIRSAYLFKVSKGYGTDNYIIFDPIRGEYKFFQ